MGQVWKLWICCPQGSHNLVEEDGCFQFCIKNAIVLAFCVSPMTTVLEVTCELGLVVWPEDRSAGRWGKEIISTREGIAYTQWLSQSTVSSRTGKSSLSQGTIENKLGQIFWRSLKAKQRRGVYV